MIAGETATFLYLGRANQVVRVALTGEWNAWDRTAWMIPAGRSGLYWRTERFDPAARVEYQFRVGRQVLADALNPHQGVRERYGPKSALLMPDYRPPSEVTPRLRRAVRRRHQHSLVSSELRQARPLSVYLPPGYQRIRPGGYPVALFHDGDDYLNHAHAATALDNSIAEGAIPPLISVFLPPVHRSEEYARAPERYAAFCATELPLFLRANYAVSPLAPGLGDDGRVLRRSDFGLSGLAPPGDLRLGAAALRLFGFADDQLIGWMEEAEPVPIGFHCVVGLYENFTASVASSPCWTVRATSTPPPSTRRATTGPSGRPTSATVSPGPFAR